MKEKYSRSWHYMELVCYKKKKLANKEEKVKSKKGF